VSGHADPQRKFEPLAESEIGELDPERMLLLQSLWRFYGDHGLVPSDGVFPTRVALPLWECCACGDGCWKGYEDRQTTNESLYGISLPWIGQLYDESRIVVVGINQRDGGGPLVQWNIAAGAINALRDGDPHPYGSPFWPGIGRYASVTASRSATDEKPEVGLDRIALLQLVKCSLTGGRGAPSPTMAETCPSRYLPGELEILEPRVVLVATMQHGDLVTRALGCELRPHGTASLNAGIAQIAGREVPIIQLRHPTDRHTNADGKAGAARSVEALQQYLAAG
jgi:hypothetical protein